MSLYQVTELSDSKPALVLLHGWGMTSDVWLPLLDLLKQHYSLYLFDLPGLGRSSAPESGNIDFDTVIQPILNKAPDKAHWLGWSLGGSAALHVAANHPERVLSLVTVASNPCFVQREDWKHAMSEQVFNEFSQAIESTALKTLTRFLMLQTQGSEKGREILRELKQQIASYKEQLPAALPETLALLATDQRALIDQLTVPWLSIWGECDQLVPVAAADALPSSNTQHQSICYAGSGHLPFYVDQDRFMNDVVRFTESTQ